MAVFFCLASALSRWGKARKTAELFDSLRFSLILTEKRPAFSEPQVELEGFEPSSKRGIRVLSTCVVSGWFSCSGCSGRATTALSP